MVADKMVRLFDKNDSTRSCFVLCHGPSIVGSSWWITCRQFLDSKSKICSRGSYLCFDSDTLFCVKKIAIVFDDGEVCGWIKTK